MIEPTLSEVITAAIDAQMLHRHFSMPGKIVRYYPEKQTADVLPVLKSPLTLRDGTIIYEKLPIVHDVPVAQPRGGDCSLHFPMEKGDHVTLVFSEVATGQWRATGEVSEPGDLERNSLSYPIGIPGTETDERAIDAANATTNEVVLALGTGKTFRVGAASAGAVALAGPIETWVDALITALGAVPATAAVASAMGAATTALHATIKATKLKAQ